MKINEKIKMLKNSIRTIYIAMKKPQTPWYAKVIAGITIGYALSPMDLIPDFIPLFGYLDDIIILPALITLTIKLIPNKILEESKVAAEDLWREGKPKKWYYGIPVVMVWIIIMVMIFSVIHKR